MLRSKSWTYLGLIDLRKIRRCMEVDLWDKCTRTWRWYIEATGASVGALRAAKGSIAVDKADAQRWRLSYPLPLIFASSGEVWNRDIPPILRSQRAVDEADAGKSLGVLSLRLRNSPNRPKQHPKPAAAASATELMF
jgi:hypothetical protein